MIVLEEPSLAQGVVESRYPVSLGFKLSEAAVYVIDWGDGSRTRSLQEAAQESHIYDAPGKYDITTQFIGFSTTFRNQVEILIKRDREKTLYRWSGPVLRMGSLNSYAEAAVDPRSPYFVGLIDPSPEGSQVITLPTGLMIEPGDSIQISQANKRFSGGKIAAILGTNSRAITVELDFQLTDSYSAGANAQLISRPSGYSKTRTGVGSLIAFTWGTDDELVHDSFGILLATSPGERVGRPELGFRGREVAFEPNDAIAASMLQAYTIEAAAAYERRLRIQGVRTSRNESELRLQIDLQFTTGLDAVFDHTLSLTPQ